MNAGAATLDITPPVGVALAGSFSARYATGVADPLTCRAVVLEDDSGPGGRVALVLCDLICMPGTVVQAVREHGADYGIALDGDADRLQMVDATGRLYNGDELLYVLVADRLAQGHGVPGAVGTLMTNMGVELALRRLDVPLRMK